LRIFLLSQFNKAHNISTFGGHKMREDLKLKIKENKKKLITNSSPVKKIKGYNSYKSLASANQKDIARKILQNSYANSIELTAQDREIKNAIYESCEKVIKDIQLSEDDFILAGHELDELKGILDKDLIRYCIYRYKYNMFPKNFIVSDYPPCVQIEITSMCNFRCIMCYQADESFSKKTTGFIGFMDIGLFKQCIDELEGRVEAVTIASRGEPLLHPLLPQMLDYCKGKFLALKLNTNASLLDEELSHALLKSDLQTLVFSIDAASKEVYEKIRVNGNFDRVVANIKRFAEIRHKHYGDSKLNVRVSGVKINDEQNLTEMSSFFDAYVDSTAFVNYNPWETSYINSINRVTQPCSDLFRRMFVWWDGVVNPCDYDYKSTLSSWRFDGGPISLSHIWQSDQYQDLRNIHLNGKRSSKEPCSRCVAV